MKATVVDLRYRMNDVLKALERNEDVQILYHGRTKGVLSPAGAITKTKVAEHPFFNMRGGMGPVGKAAGETEGQVEKEMDRLRGGRYRDL